MNIEKNLKYCLNQILESKHLIICTHTNPDGDAIGSSVALLSYCLDKGIDAHIYLNELPPKSLRFLLNSDKIKVFDPKYIEHFLLTNTIVVLDLNDSKRLKNIEDIVRNSSATKVMIDHHVEPKKFVDIMAIDTEASSTGELIWRLLKLDENYSLSKVAAEAIYVAIMTDTGNFRHSKTDAEVFRICADLVEAGADPVQLYDDVYNSNTYQAVKLLGEALRSLILYYDGRLCVMTITADLLQKTNAKNDDLDGFVEKTLQIEGVVAGIMFADVPERDEVRISLRSIGDYSVRNVAAKFGGGGHNNAAGIRMHNIDIEEAKKMVIQESYSLFAK